MSFKPSTPAVGRGYNRAAVSSAEHESQSFLFRIWREDPSEDDPPLNFRGHMTCLLDGTRIYVQSWIEVQAFINSYLEASANKSETAGTG